MPLFSVIIPTYNRERLVLQTLESVFAQTFTDFEVIVIDDGSTDDTPAVLTKVAEAQRGKVRVIRQANQGVCVARNTAARQAVGEYIALLDSDDLWFPWTLANYAHAIAEYNRPSLLLGTPLPFSEQPPSVEPGPLSARQWRDLLTRLNDKWVWLITGATVVRADVWAASGGFAESGNTEDIDLLFRLATVVGFVNIESPPAYAYRQHQVSRCANADVSYQGYCHIINRERTGQYPGGPARESDRRRVIAYFARLNCWDLLRDRRPWLALRFFFQTLWLQRWLPRPRFLIFFPVQAVALGIFGWRGGLIKPQLQH